VVLIFPGCLPQAHSELLFYPKGLVSGRLPWTNPIPYRLGTRSPGSQYSPVFGLLPGNAFDGAVPGGDTNRASQSLII
jgi:hypothetical protein